MALGPDPNRFQPTDPEMQPEDYKHGDSIGDLKSSRLGMPLWASVLIAVVAAGFMLYLAFRG
ncbi:hypothetical protein [Longimicrobium terrae]|uniref:Uncharacterized protein n=1 Tax=Longimicrobium terrae TaxID=1639882 RepID=A0A841GMD0_9BACT|nr:hypothetical protein [Longimicrobium terrae]MBB4634658.1 hypothetical protein [Longimicrobium terrae]MBB6068452.1 hypothetical protein [Longimicrobium terrae]NNC32733.1 hypothetical protein [Longimicrobium terrae]